LIFSYDFLNPHLLCFRASALEPCTHGSIPFFFPPQSRVRSGDSLAHCSMQNACPFFPLLDGVFLFQKTYTFSERRLVRRLRPLFRVFDRLNVGIRPMSPLGIHQRGLPKFPRAQFPSQALFLVPFFNTMKAPPRLEIS